RYYSVERSQWEEKPLDLVDLKRTESEMAERQTQLSEETKAGAEEEKAVRELHGLHSPNILGNPEQEFYIQLSAEERFGIVKLTPEHGIRIVEKITIVQVTKEVIEEPIEVQVFRKQMTQDGLYKLWPMKPMSPGEYAVVQYTPGKTNMQVWDFA